MKKLVILNHLGEVVLERDVYVEGQDFACSFPVVTPLWVKEIYICEPDNFPTYVDLAEKIEKQAEESNEKGVEFGEPETAINPSVGDEGTGKTEQSPSAAETSEKPARRKATKRSKRVRDSKAT